MYEKIKEDKLLTVSFKLLRLVHCFVASSVLYLQSMRFNLFSLLKDLKYLENILYSRKVIEIFES